MGENKMRCSSMALKYMRYLRLMLASVGAWPDAAVNGRPRRVPYYVIYLILQTSTITTGELLFIISRFNILSFFDLGDACIALSLSFLILFRAALVCFKTYGTIFRDFVTKFHLAHFKHKSEYFEIMYQRTNQISLYLTRYMIGLLLSGIVSFNITALYRNHRHGVFRRDPPVNGSMEFSVHYVYPGFVQEDYFLISTLINWYVSYVCAFLVCTVDLALCLMIIQIIGHIRVLAHRMRTFPKPRKVEQLQELRKRQGNNIKKPIMVEIVKTFDDQENKIIKEIIIECVQHHLIIVSFTENMSSFFGPMLAFNYLYHMFSFSLLLVESMQGEEALIHYGPLTLMTLAQLTQLSVTFEIVATESEKLQDEVYYVPWESMSVSNQRSVGFLLKRVQTPIRVTALGMTSVGVQTMAGIIKTTLSYCAFLRSLNQ